MRLLGRCGFFSLRVFLSAGTVVLATACAVYDDSSPTRGHGGAAGSGATGAAGGMAGTGGQGAASGGGGTGSNGTGGSEGGSGGAGGTKADASIDADATRSDAPVPPDARETSASDTQETGSPDEGGTTDTPPPYSDATIDGADAPIGSDASDVTSPPGDVLLDARSEADADAAFPDASVDNRDAAETGPTGPQILPARGTPIENADASAPFQSRCASDEVVTGFIGRAGVQTDAIASTCSKISGGVLSSPRNLPLNGNLTGGNAFTVTCPSNHVAISIVGRYGHNTMWNEDVTTAIGVVCKSLSSSATQTVTITGQPALDSGYSTFREDCTGGRYLTCISGLTDSNALGYTVQKVGGECDYR